MTYQYPTLDMYTPNQIKVGMVVNAILSDYKGVIEYVDIEHDIYIVVRFIDGSARGCWQHEFQQLEVIG